MIDKEIDKKINIICLNMENLFKQHKRKLINNFEYKIKYEAELKSLLKYKPHCKWQHKLSITILEIINKINKIILK